MKPSGDGDLTVRTRTALLDALEALEDQLAALIVIGAQALYLHTGDVEVPIPAETKDADIGVDRQNLLDDPLLEQAIEDAGFHKDLKRAQPGRWISPDGIPVDLMIPESMAGPFARNRRGARVPPHDRGSMRRARGLEGTIVDSSPTEIGSLDRADHRSYVVRVAGPGALLVAKLHKLGDRAEESEDRFRKKDAHDLYRLLVAVDTPDLARTVSELLSDPFSTEAVGSSMAGAAEEGIGEPEIVAASVAALAGDLLAAVDGFAEPSTPLSQPACFLSHGGDPPELRDVLSQRRGSWGG